MASTALRRQRSRTWLPLVALVLALAGCGGGDFAEGFVKLVSGEPSKDSTTAELALTIGDAALSGNLLVNPSFEQPVATGALPTVPGAWHGDPAGVAGTEMGIVPHDGATMLRFAATSTGNTFATTAAEQWQVVDLSAHADAIAAGGMRARLDGWFNRVAGEEADRRFDLRVMAFDGNPSDLPARYAASNWLAEATAPLVSLPNQWQQATATLALPPGTTYLLVEVVASEDLHNDGEGIEFAGHYADDLSLVLLPAP